MPQAPLSAQPSAPVYAIKLDVFEGPLDLLLHLIQRNEMEITDIRISEVTDQYLAYLNLMEMLDLDVASDFLVMAATLLQLKSESLLPVVAADDEGKPFKDRESLVRQLLEYKQFKEAALAFEHYAAEQEKTHSRVAPLHADVTALRDIQVRATLFDLLTAFRDVLEQRTYVAEDEYTEIQEERITVEDKMAALERDLGEHTQVWFNALFTPFSSKLERIVTFLAVLELVRLQRVVAVQSEHFGDIYLKAAMSGEL